MKGRAWAGLGLRASPAREPRSCNLQAQLPVTRDVDGWHCVLWLKKIMFNSEPPRSAQTAHWNTQIGRDNLAGLSRITLFCFHNIPFQNAFRASTRSGWVGSYPVASKLCSWRKSRVSGSLAPGPQPQTAHGSLLLSTLRCTYLMWALLLVGFGTRDRGLTRREVFPQAGGWGRRQLIELRKWAAQKQTKNSG